MDHKILVVDDVWENIYIVERILKKEGYYVKTANSAALALDMVHKEKFDLILLDLQMPEMDGFTVCKILKADSRFSGIPVIFLTATNEPQSISKGFKIGGSDYLTKPFNPSELIARIHNHLELKEKREGQKREIRLARQIQEKLLPINLEEIKGLQFSVKYLPYGELSGDIYDIAEIFPGYIRIFLADATGHGISAALVTMLIKSEYETIKSSFASPAKTLMELNTRFIQNYINLNEIFPAFILDIDLNTM
ncbi:MAG: response regulator, partial [Leptospiraceae bacterium]|nr:response regulator [Leptospiraceae bacterium]